MKTSPCSGNEDVIDLLNDNPNGSFRWFSRPAPRRSDPLRYLGASYDRNPLQADQQFKGRRFQIGGTVKEIESDEEVYLDLEAPAELHTIFRVHCRLC